MTNKDMILLVYPRCGADAKKVSLHPPLPLLYLATALRDFSVTIFDERTDDPKRFDELLEQKPLCVGFSIFTGQQIKYALNLAEKAKQHHLVTVFGGIHTTILPEQTQADPRVDVVVKGDGEFAFRRLVRALQKGESIENVIIAENLTPAEMDQLGDLPYDLIDVENYITTAALEGRSLPFLFSRGCPYRCTFCCNPAISHGKWRSMSAAAAIDRLNVMVDKYNLDAIFFLDENLMVNANTMNHLAKGIDGRFHWGAQVRADSILQYEPEFLENSGAKFFGIGLESGSDRILKKIKKQETVEQFIQANRRLAKTNINIWYNYLTGFPDETLDDLKMTVDLAVKMMDENDHADNNPFYLLTPYPGTEIGELLKDEMPDNLEGWSEFGRHNYSARWHSPERMKLYQRIGFSSKFVGRRLMRLFPDDTELADVAARMTDKWRRFDFDDDTQWDQLNESGWNVLKSHFGANAY